MSTHYSTPQTRTQFLLEKPLFGWESSAFYCESTGGRVGQIFIVNFRLKTFTKRIKRNKKLFRFTCSFIVITGLSLFGSKSVSASPIFVPSGPESVTISPSWDLLLTNSAQFDLGPGIGIVPFVSNPISSFDFGTGGVNLITPTDTIIHRTGANGVPGASITLTNGQTKSMDLVVADVSLRTANKITVPERLDPAMGQYYFYETISTTKLSTGTIDITYNRSASGGSWVNHFHIFVDIRLGSATGAIVMADVDTYFTGVGDWQLAPVGYTIPGVNIPLNGAVDPLGSFYVATTGGDQTAPGGKQHGTIPPVPEPGSIGLLLSGAGIAGFWGWRRSNRKSSPEGTAV